MFLSSGWLLLLYPAVVSCVGVFLNHCAEGDKAAPTLLPDDIKIHPPYKACHFVTAVFTDWMANTTMVIDEMRFENSKMVETTSRNNASKWITMKDQRVIFSNDTGCSLVNKSTLFTLPDEFKDLGQHEVTSLSGLVDSILANKISGFKSFVRVVAGVEGVGWIRCINNTNSSSVVSVEVVYAGDDSFNPPSPSFKNPVILSLAYSHYSNGSDINSTMLYRVSLDFSPFRKPLDAESQFEIAHGMACKDMNRTEMDIKFPRQFEVMYTKQNSSSLLTSKLMYDSDRNMTAESVIDGVALLFNKSFTKEKYLVVRAKEKEYVFSSSPVCSYGHFSTGGNVSSNEFPPAIDLFIPQFSTLNFSLYSNISEDAMNVHIVEYRAQWGDKVIEIVLHNYTLSTVSIYAKERVLESIGSLTIKELKPNFEDSIDLDSLLRECFNREVNNLFSFVLKGVSSTNSWREDVVSNKLATALTSIPNATISPYRLSFFYIGKEDKYMINDDLRVVMRVADERGTAAEMSSSDFVTLLNSTLPGGISIPVSDTQAWKATEPLEGYPPVSPVVPPSFSGYTGGSMLVMGLFMVMLGVVLGAGGVYLAFRRQRISTLAYQVFE